MQAYPCYPCYRYNTNLPLALVTGQVVPNPMRPTTPPPAPPQPPVVFFRELPPDPPTPLTTNHDSTKRDRFVREIEQAKHDNTYVELSSDDELVRVTSPNPKRAKPTQDPKPPNTKARKTYTCTRCGQPKKGHKCTAPPAHTNPHTNPPTTFVQCVEL